MKLIWLRYVYAQRLRSKLAAEGECCSDRATLREGKGRCPLNFVCLSHEQALQTEALDAPKIWDQADLNLLLWASLAPLLHLGISYVG